MGRLAMSGFLSAVIGELITGKGALGQLRLGMFPEEVSWPMHSTPVMQVFGKHLCSTTVLTSCISV